jgi:hypothetical protein
LKLAIKDEIESMITVQVETKLAPLKQEMWKLREENIGLKKELSEISSKQDRVEQYGRKYNARIGNHPYDKDENTDYIARTVASRPGVVIEPNEIDVSPRTGKANDDKPREIIVKFCSVKSKSKFMKCSK